MWQFLINMSIARRLMIAAAITALIPGIVISVLGGSYIGTLQTINNTVKSSNDAVKLVTDMQADLLRMNSLLEVLNTDPGSAVSNVQNSREITQLATNFGTSSASYQKNYQITTSANMKSIRDTLQGNTLGTQASISQHSMIYVVNLQWQIYQSAQNQVLHDVQDQASANTLADDVAQANLEYLPLKGNLDNLVSLTESISQVVSQINTFKINPTLFWTIVAFLVSTLVVFALSYLINLTITRPLRRLVQLTERIAQGETDARAFVTGHDETYMVATSMNTMLDSIARLMQNVQHQHNMLETRVNEFIVEVKGFGSGDLRTRAEVTADELGFLAHSLNYALEKLSGLIAHVKTASNEVENITRTTQASVSQLVPGNVEQMQSITTAAEAIENLDNATKTIMDEVRTLTALAQKTRRFGQALSENDERKRAEEPGSFRTILELIEQQAGLIESIEANLSQQILLCRRALQSVQRVVEGSRQRKTCIDEANDQVSKLARAVGDLQSSVSVFKIQEDHAVSQKLS